MLSINRLAIYSSPRRTGKNTIKECHSPLTEPGSNSNLMDARWDVELFSIGYPSDISNFVKSCRCNGKYLYDRRSQTTYQSRRNLPSSNASMALTVSDLGLTPQDIIDELYFPSLNP